MRLENANSAIVVFHQTLIKTATYRYVSALIPDCPREGRGHILKQTQGSPGGEILLLLFATHFISLSDKKTIQSDSYLL